MRSLPQCHARPTCRPPPSLLFGPSTRSCSFHPSDPGVEHMSDPPIHHVGSWNGKRLFRHSCAIPLSIGRCFCSIQRTVSRVIADPIYPVRTALPIRRRWLHNSNGFRDLSSFLPLFASSLSLPGRGWTRRPCPPPSFRPFLFLPLLDRLLRSFFRIGEMAKFTTSPVEDTSRVGENLR